MNKNGLKTQLRIKSEGSEYLASPWRTNCESCTLPSQEKPKVPNDLGHCRTFNAVAILRTSHKRDNFLVKLQWTYKCSSCFV